MSEQCVSGLGFWSGHPVAVTGATGFVGSHLTAELVRSGATVVVLTRDDVPGNPVAATWAHRVATVRGDVTDQAVVERMLGEYGTRTLFHLAAQSQVGVANRNPVSTFDANIRGTWTVLEAARRTPSVRAVVVASSDKAYGSHAALPYDEDAPLTPVNPYDVSKACADLLATSYALSFDLPVSVTRCGNFFGPGDLNWSRLVPGTVRSLLRGERPLIRSDGTMVRDYLDVRDGVAAYLLLGEALCSDPGLKGRAFNFSLEQPLSVLEMVSRLQEAAGTDLEPEVLGTATHEIPVQILSSARARAELGWRPCRDLGDALGDTVDWYRRYLEDSPGR